MSLNATLDKSTYAPNEKMTLTVRTAAGERDVVLDTPGTAHIDVPGVGSGDAPFVLHRTLAMPAPITVTDSTGKTWSPVSDNGTTATYTATA